MKLKMTVVNIYIFLQSLQIYNARQFYLSLCCCAYWVNCHLKSIMLSDNLAWFMLFAICFEIFCILCIM